MSPSPRRCAIPGEMTILAAVLLLAAPQGAPTATPDLAEARLLEGAAAWLRVNLADPASTRFRRVHLRRSTGQDGKRHVTLCGQLLQDDPRAPADWSVFAAAQLGDRVDVRLDASGMVDAARICAPTLGEWDYARDWSEKFAAELATR